LRAIQGRGAFRYFKDMVDRYGLRDEWFEFKERALKEIAREALEEAGIPFIEGPYLRLSWLLWTESSLSEARR
jgi:hypothetical protein